ncbi:uncharacterized protein L969DRAFT_96405 [Mixia osmundae IAM 14324]|uniref:Uncharacterized protein n=1 Tax=Mixia osmundae (strain CBS 9802 / IAM 14324 / JCM 22182 / KY 12970) TaxID=764103 RepID=G7DWG3_MIXOS|nr:uncharacterized protein L969DRAFT_96405 [Mixia osmundae IAM 14324]KEI37325.1 hypothetical protein L969DRAFT_96405 [Mixia osmundae IAM 14324]GAA94923.1 hypothetical protein E5Q_01578 [Mixia osmundae IAM 14324]
MTLKAFELSLENVDREQGGVRASTAILAKLSAGGHDLTSGNLRARYSHVALQLLGECDVISPDGSTTTVVLCDEAVEHDFAVTGTSTEQGWSIERKDGSLSFSINVPKFTNDGVALPGSFSLAGLPIRNAGQAVLSSTSSVTVKYELILRAKRRQLLKRSDKVSIPVKILPADLLGGKVPYVSEIARKERAWDWTTPVTQSVDLCSTLFPNVRISKAEICHRLKQTKTDFVCQYKLIIELATPVPIDQSVVLTDPLLKSLDVEIGRRILFGVPSNAPMICIPSRHEQGRMSLNRSDVTVAAIRTEGRVIFDKRDIMAADCGALAISHCLVLSLTQANLTGKLAISAPIFEANASATLSNEPKRTRSTPIPALPPLFLSGEVDAALARPSVSSSRSTRNSSDSATLPSPHKSQMATSIRSIAMASSQSLPPLSPSFFSSMAQLPRDLQALSRPPSATSTRMRSRAYHHASSSDMSATPSYSSNESRSSSISSASHLHDSPALKNIGTLSHALPEPDLWPSPPLTPKPPTTEPRPIGFKAAKLLGLPPNASIVG